MPNLFLDYLLLFLHEQEVYSNTPPRQIKVQDNINNKIHTVLSPKITKFFLPHIQILLLI